MFCSAYLCKYNFKKSVFLNVFFFFYIVYFILSFYSLAFFYVLSPLVLFYQTTSESTREKNKNEKMSEKKEVIQKNVWISQPRWVVLFYIKRIFLNKTPNYNHIGGNNYVCKYFMAVLSVPHILTLRIKHQTTMQIIMCKKYKAPEHLYYQVQK